MRYNPAVAAPPPSRKRSDRNRLLLSSALAAALWALVAGTAGLILVPAVRGADAGLGEVVVLIGDAREPRPAADGTPRPADPAPAPAPALPPGPAPTAPNGPAEAQDPTAATSDPASAADPEQAPARPEAGAGGAAPAEASRPAAGSAPGDAAGTPASPAPGATGPAAGERKPGQPSATVLSLLAAAVEKNKSYPPQAKRRKIQGRVVAEIEVGRDGVLAELALAESSGSELLDRAALDLLRKIFPLEGARGAAFRTKVAIDYALTEPKR